MEVAGVAVRHQPSAFGRQRARWPGCRVRGPDPVTGPDSARGAEAGNAIGNGDFALHAHNIFLTTAPVFSSATEEAWHGRMSIRYDFQVPRARSQFSVGSVQKAAVVGYHGTFWVDAGTLGLMRLEVHAGDIPAEVGISADSNVVEYGRSRIGDSDFVLPSSSELTMIDRDGNESRNRSQLSSCRQYLGESVISFAESSSLPEAPKAPQSLHLPAGLSVVVNLAAPIALDGAIVDPVSATLANTVRKGSTVVIDKGAVLSGRISRLDKREAEFGAYYAIGIEFSSLAAGDSRSDFPGRLEEVGLDGNQYFVPFASDPGRSVSIWSSLPHDRH